MSKPVIFLALDSVLVNFIQGTLKVLGVTNYSIPINEPSMEKWIGVNVTTGEFWKAIDATNEKFWAELEPYHYAKDLVKVCESFGETFILTAPARNPYCLAGKKMWIQKHFPRLSGKMIITKHKYLCAAPDRILIDDNNEQIDKFAQFGGGTILFPQLFNRNHSLAGVDKVEYVKLFLETYGKN
jgi:5'(3')-deoxyribonucleotidase